MQVARGNDAAYSHIRQKQTEKLQHNARCSCICYMFLGILDWKSTRTHGSGATLTEVDLRKYVPEVYTDNYSRTWAEPIVPDPNNIRSITTMVPNRKFQTQSASLPPHSRIHILGLQKHTNTSCEPGPKPKQRETHQSSNSSRFTVQTLPHLQSVTTSNRLCSQVNAQPQRGTKDRSAHNPSL